MGTSVIFKMFHHFVWCYKSVSMLSSQYVNVNHVHVVMTSIKITFPFTKFLHNDRNISQKPEGIFWEIIVTTGFQSSNDIVKKNFAQSKNDIFFQEIQ